MVDDMLVPAEFSQYFLSVFELNISMRWKVEIIYVSHEFMQAAQPCFWPNSSAWQDISHFELAIMLS
jgi:hypothetical protein